MTEPSTKFEAIRTEIGYVQESNEDSINCCDGDRFRGMFIVPSQLVTSRPSNITTYVMGAKNSDGKIQWVPNYLKRSVRLASISNVDLNTVTSIDGVNLDFGDRVLIRNQTDSTENGIYVYEDPGLVRSDDAQVNYDASLIVVLSTEGLTNSLSIWTIIDVDILFGESLTFFKVAGGGAGSPGGPNNSVQFNNAGTFDGSSNFLWNGTDLTIAVPTFITDTTDSTSSNTGALVVSGGIGIGSNVYCDGVISAVNHVCISDRYAKENIEPIVDAKRIIMGLNPVKYRLKCNKRNTFGVIAQELLEIPELRDLVYSNESSGRSTFGVEYNGLFGLLLKSNQELIIKQEKLEQRIDRLEKINLEKKGWFY